jgi:hypothetical protein
VAKRLARRLRELGLADLDAYRGRLETHPEEWTELAARLGIPISRFWRDRGAFESIEREVLTALARQASDAGRDVLVCWSAGCASGEEPYTFAIAWQLRLQPAFARLRLQIVATDCDAQLLDRARTGCYAASSLKELPADLRAAAFDERDGRFCVRPQWRSIEFLRQDLREQMPDGGALGRRPRCLLRRQQLDRAAVPSHRHAGGDRGHRGGVQRFGRSSPGEGRQLQLARIDDARPGPTHADALAVLPPRTARRSASGTPLGPHRATRSASIIAASTFLPA